MSSSRHPQRDGSSETMNRMIENCFRCFYSHEEDNLAKLLPAVDFAYISSNYRDMVMTRFEMDLRWNWKTTLDVWPRAPNNIVQKLRDLTAQLEEFIKDAQYAYKLAKARQAAYSGEKVKPRTYREGRKVWTKHTSYKDAYPKSQHSDKLNSRNAGPFRTIELLGKHALKLILPAHLNTNLVIHVVHTVI